MNQEADIECQHDFQTFAKAHDANLTFYIKLVEQ